MSEEERISRDRLLKRAAAAAGVVYAAPVLMSSAEAATQARCRGRCTDEAECQAKNLRCHCVNGRCTTQPPQGCVGTGCAVAACCDVANFCDPDGSGDCICFLLQLSPGIGGDPRCVGFPSNFCSDYQPCDTQADCPPGTCCMCTCCPTGICSPSDCTAPLARKASAGAGATLTL